MPAKYVLTSPEPSQPNGTMRREDEVYKAISIKQPFGSLIMTGDKIYETRNWPTNYRGKLLICASAQPHRGLFYAGSKGTCLLLSPCRNAVKESPSQYPLGVMLCLVDLIDCRPMVETDEYGARCRIYPKAWSWVLTNPQPVVQHKLKGQLRLFNVEKKLVEIL